MSETGFEEQTVNAVVKTFVELMKQIKEATQEIMEIHPMCAFVILQLYGHLGYSFIKDGNWNIGGEKRSTMRDAIAESFFHMGEKLDLLLSTEGLKNITPLVTGLTGSAIDLATLGTVKKVKK